MEHLDQFHVCVMSSVFVEVSLWLLSHYSYQLSFQLFYLGNLGKCYHQFPQNYITNRIVRLSYFCFFKCLFSSRQPFEYKLNSKHNCSVKISFNMCAYVKTSKICELKFCFRQFSSNRQHR